MNNAFQFKQEEKKSIIHDDTFRCNNFVKWVVRLSLIIQKCKVAYLQNKIFELTEARIIRCSICFDRLAYIIDVEEEMRVVFDCHALCCGNKLKVFTLAQFRS